MRLVAAPDLHAQSDVIEPGGSTVSERGMRMSPEEAAAAWRALCEGRWEIVKWEERDGRRFLVARPDASLSVGARRAAAGPDGSFQPDHLLRLSAQERRILAKLAKGHSNKVIAYDLGLATSTVASVLARAARKLGCSNRIALARVGRVLADQPAGETGAQGLA